MKPENFTGYPWGSITKNGECELIAQNIMKILKRTGNEFRSLTWDEYKAERLKDGAFTESEKEYFDMVIGYCSDAKRATEFCSHWSNK